MARGGSHSSFIGGESNVKVIDMTGRTARVLSSYDDLKEQLSKGSNTQGGDSTCKNACTCTCKLYSGL